MDPQIAHCPGTLAVMVFLLLVSLEQKRLGTPFEDISLSFTQVFSHGEFWRIATAGVSHHEGVHLASVLFGLWVCRGLEVAEGTLYFMAAVVVGLVTPSALALGLRRRMLVASRPGHSISLDRSSAAAVSLISGPPTCGFSPALFCLLGAGNGTGSVPLLATLLCLVWFPTLAPHADTAISHFLGIIVGVALSTRAVALDARRPYWIVVWTLFVAAVFLVSRRASLSDGVAGDGAEEDENGNSGPQPTLSRRVLGGRATETTAATLPLSPFDSTALEAESGGGGGRRGDAGDSGGGNRRSCCVLFDRCLVAAVREVDLEPSSLITEGMRIRGDSHHHRRHVHEQLRDLEGGGGGGEPSAFDQDDGSRSVSNGVSTGSDGDNSRVNVDLTRALLPIDGLLAVMNRYRNHRQRLSSANIGGGGGSEDGSGGNERERAHLLGSGGRDRGESARQIGSGHEDDHDDDHRDGGADDDWLLGDGASHSLLPALLEEAWTEPWTVATSPSSQSSSSSTPAWSDTILVNTAAGRTLIRWLSSVRSFAVDLCGWVHALLVPLLSLASLGLQVLRQTVQGLWRSVSRTVRQRQRRTQQPQPQPQPQHYQQQQHLQRHGRSSSSSQPASLLGPRVGDNSSGFWGGGGGGGRFEAFVAPTDGWEIPSPEAMTALLPPLAPHRNGPISGVGGPGWPESGDGNGERVDQNAEESELQEAIRLSMMMEGGGGDGRTSD